MRRLILLRHAKAVAKNDAGDFERALSPEGRAESALVATTLSQAEFQPDLALVSTARRTRETWELASAKLTGVATAFEDAIYEASPEQLMDVLREADGASADDAAATVILVGHNPGVTEVAQILLGDSDEGRRAELERGMPTGSLVVLDLDIETWRQLQPGIARLVSFVSPASSVRQR